MSIVRRLGCVLALAGFVACGMEGERTAKSIRGLATPDDVSDPAPPPILTEPPGPPNSPSWQATTDNGNGTFTFQQMINAASTPPHYVKPNGYGFGVYSWWNQDYGWQHDFPAWNTPGLVIHSVKLTVRAWDVDSEPSHGVNGEYDGLKGDGQWLDPQYLQGTNNTWSVTNFDVAPAAVAADGKLALWLNIDMNHSFNYWATTLDYSWMTIVYSFDNNQAPYLPTIQVTPLGIACDTDPLSVAVTGPTPADPDGDAVTYEYRWFVDVGNGFYLDDEFAGRGNHAGATVPAADTVFGDKWKIVVTPIDSKGRRGPAAEAYFQIGNCNTPPVVSMNGGSTATVDEGSTYSQTGSFVDPDSDTWTATVDYGDGSGTVALALNGKTFELNHIYADNGTYLVNVTVNDGKASDSTQISVTVNNVAPTVAPIQTTVDPVAIGTEVSFSSSFTDPGTLDTHTGSWQWDDGTTSPAVISSGLATGTHAFTTPGIYTIGLTVTDKDGGTGTTSYQYVVIYDPSAGFVTGGGWILSPAGALTADPTLTGRANFGFVAKYKRGATVPDGSTEFQFQAGNLNFHSSSYAWLVVAGAKAIFKGRGTINGAGSYGFLISAIDGQLAGGNGTDKFRIKIWDVATNAVVYDNQAFADETAAPTTVLSGGSIAIHTK